MYQVIKYNKRSGRLLTTFKNKRAAVDFAKSLHKDTWPSYVGIRVMATCFNEKIQQVVFDTNLLRC